MGKGLSIIAFVLSLLFFIPFAPLAGVILGIIALVKAKDKDDLKGLAIAAIAVGGLMLVLSIFVVFYAGIFQSGFKINSLSAQSAMPLEILNLSIKIPSYMVNSTIGVRFSDNKNYTVDVPLVYYNSKSAIVSVPPYFTEKGNFSSGVVSIMLTANDGDKEYVSNKITGFEIKNLPTVNELPGTITLAYLTKMIETSNSLIERIAQVNLNGVSTEELRQVLLNQRNYLIGLKNSVNSVMQNPKSTYAFGEFNGQELKLNKETLGLTDRLIAGYLLQYGQEQQTSGITGDVVLTGSDVVTLDSIGNSFENMFKNINQGITANKEAMSSLGGTMMSVGGAIAVFGGPGGVAVGGAVAGVGAVMWFVGLHANTALMLAMDASVSSALNPDSTSAQKTVGDYTQEMLLTGASTVAAETGTFIGSMADNILSLKGAAELLNKFNKNADTANGKSPETPETPGDDETLLLMVGGQGDGDGTITSNPPGISCPGKCSQEYLIGAQVTLYAQEGSDSSFEGWVGSGCSGTGSCEVAIEEDIAVKGIIAFMARFDKVAPPQPSGNGRCSSLSSSNACGPCSSKADCDGENCWINSNPPFC